MSKIPGRGAMLPADTFRGRTILITGGGSGLGRSMGELLLTLGAQLAICGRRADVLEKAAAELATSTGGEVFAKTCDVRHPEQVETLCEAVSRHFGPIHGLVNNAAGNFICPTERLTPKGFSAVVDIVLKGTFHCTHAIGKRWLEQGQPGAIVNIVTTYAWTGSGYVVPSAVAKAGVLALTRSLAVEWGRRQVRTNAVAPGPFPTEGAWSRLFPPQVSAGLDPARTIPLGRVGEHLELANLVSFLLSDYAAYINGDCLTIDGGQWLHGAGTFNFLEDVSPEQWAALAAAQGR